MKLFAYIFFFFAFCINLFAFQDDEESAVDSSYKPVVVYDTTAPKPSLAHGKIEMLKFSGYKNINKRNLLSTNYSGLFEILSENIPAYPLNAGTIGASNHLSFLGSNPKEMAFSFNGRRLVDIDYLSFDLNTFPSEFIENAQIFIGSDAVIYSGSSSYINLQEIKYNTAVPYTRLWYSQGSYGYIAADGIYSQNIARGWNLTLGFRSMSSEGRFENSAMESWNLRAILRWNLSDYSSISFTENFSNHGHGTNGGINQAESQFPFDVNASVPYFRYLDERRYKHDLSLTYSNTFEKDSKSALAVTAFMSNTENMIDYKNEASFLKLDSSGIMNWRSRYFGINGRLELQAADFVKLVSGAEIINIDIQKNLMQKAWSGIGYSAYGKVEIIQFDPFILSGGARIESIFEKNLFSLGAKAEYRSTKYLSLFVDFSVSMRPPSIAQGLNLDPENHVLGIFGVKYNDQDFQIEVNGFARLIDNPILMQVSLSGSELIPQDCGCDNRQIYGANAIISTEIIKNLGASLSTQAYYTRSGDKDDRYLPVLYSTIDTYYKYSVGRSTLQAGLKTSFIGLRNVYYYYPIEREYLQYPYKTGWSNDGINAYAALKLGDAYVRFEMKNLLSTDYYYMPFYPANDMSYLFSVSWAFNN